MKVLAVNSYTNDEAEEICVHVYDIYLFEDRKKALFNLLKSRVSVDHFCPMHWLEGIDFNNLGFELEDVQKMPKSLQGTALEYLERKENVEQAPAKMKEYLHSIENRVNAAQSDEDLKEINDELGERWGIVSLYDKETVTEIENVDNIKYKYFPL